ncbi:MAG: DUF262 domain-containing protein [Acetatifactor sp.]
MDIHKSDFSEYLKLSETAMSEYNGIEIDVDGGSENMEIDAPYDVQNIRVAQKMITVFQIEHWISAENGVKLNLSPEYQRNLVWDDVRKSALIESLLLRIPIPAFYLDEDCEGNKSVIDGMQRLSTIHSFLNNEFPLKKMQYLSHCENKYFKDLEPKLRGRIEDTELAVNILDEKCPQMVKFDVFRRVNTGGLPLNYQEIRNIMAAPKVRALLQRMAECEEFSRATRGSVRDIRMAAQELCLRYLTILGTYNWEKQDFAFYYGLMKMMDHGILILNKSPEHILDGLFYGFRQVMNYCYEILGEYAFCKTENSKVNKSLFTGWAVLFANVGPDMDMNKVDPVKVRTAYRQRLTKDADFYSAITSSTGTRKNILISIGTIRDIWEECYDKNH